MSAITFNNFLGGINEALSSNLIKPNEASAAQNCSIDDGSMASVNGSTLYLTPPTTNTIKTIMNYYNNGDNFLIAAAGGELFQYDGTSWSNVASELGSDSWDYVNDNYDNGLVVSPDVIVMSNGVDPVKLWDGKNFVNLRHDGKDSTAGGDNIVNGRYLDLHFERLWVADDYNLYFSTANANGFDIEDFRPLTNPPEEINQHGGMIFCYTNDGSKITAVHVCFNDILVFMNKQIYKIFGYDTSNYQKTQLFSSNGAIADKSIAVTEKGCFYINTDGIYFYDGSNVTLISNKIRKTFSNINKAYIQDSTAIFYNKKYIVAVPEGDSSSNNLIIEFDTTNNNFMLRRGISVTSFLEYKKKLLFVGPDNLIYEYGSDTTYNGTAIDSYWTTGYGDQGIPEAVKEIEKVYITASGYGDLRIQLITERGSKEKTIALSSSTEKVYPINLAHRGRLLSVKVDNPGGSVFNIKDIKLILELDED